MILRDISHMIDFEDGICVMCYVLIFIKHYFTVFYLAIINKFILNTF